MSNSLLKEFICEVMKGPSDDSDLALLIKVVPRKSVELVLYRPVEMKRLMLAGRGRTTFADAVVASIDAFINEDAGGYYEVQAVAAMPGWGPIMYDKTMSITGGLIPDRLSVSPAAQKVWEYYYHKRPDVTHSPVSDVRLHLDDVLDCGYSLDSDGPDTVSMEARHQQFLADPELEVIRIPLEKLIIEAGDRFFVENKRRLKR